MDNIYCPIRAVIRNRTQGSLAYPTAAERRSLQWVSDGRSRGAEPRGRWEVCYAPQRRCFAACSGFQTVGPATRNLCGDGRFAIPHSCAASQLAVGFRWSVPLCGTYEVRWEMTASCGYAQCPEGTRLYETHCKLRSSAAVGTNELPLLPYRSPKGDVWLFVGEEVLVNRQPTLYVYIL